MEKSSRSSYPSEPRNNENSFGAKIREMRYQRGIGIKKLAPELGVDYSYLSRIENNKVLPSAEIIERFAKYFNQDKDELMILADRVPEDVMRILRERPKETLALLRESFKANVNRT